MKKYFILYKPFLTFIATFLLAYLVLTFGYANYLNQFEINKLQADNFTQMVGNQAVNVLHFFTNEVFSTQNNLGLVINYKGKNVVQIIEGCNGMSVIILFIAFVMAFSGRFKPTLLYILVGSLFIYGLNILRIVLLVSLLYHFPEQEHILHGVLFPLLIYGFVFVLWIIWVNKFSGYAKK